MAYRLKSIRYKTRECHILLQNENGPCPLLAAANCLLLQGRIELPPSAIRNNVASLSDLTNVLANVALESGNNNDMNNNNGDGDHSFHMHELLEHIPALQYGMDVNPKFTAGIHGYEFTAQLHCFDIWRVAVVHGWLLDPHETSEELFAAIGQKTYNQIIELVIQGKEAEQALPALEAQLRQTPVPTQVDLLSDTVVDTSAAATQQQQQQQYATLQQQIHALQHKATIGTWIDHWLQDTGHQLTQYGLHQIHQDLPEGSLAVFFRNNHFSTITKQEGLLYLLVTDLGYAGTPQIVWEKLDMINGDTEHVNSMFKTVGQVSQENNAAVVGSLSPEALLAQSSQKDADYHLALHLSMAGGDNQGGGNAQNNTLDAREGQLMAAATEASLREYHGLNNNNNNNNNTTTTTTTATTNNPQVAVGVPLDGGTRVALPPKSSGSNMDADHLLALQLAQQGQQQQHQQFGPPCDDMASYRLAQQLQAEENQRAAARRNNTTTPRPAAAASKSSNCVIS